MILQYNGKQVLELTETQKKVLKYDISADIFDADMTRRCKYWLESPCEKYAHANKEKLTKELKAKGRKDVPVNLLKLAEVHAEDHPVKMGYADIKDVTCKVGNQSFVLPKAHIKVWRKINEGQQKDNPDYLTQETQILGSRMSEILLIKYEGCLDRLKLEWLPKLEAKGIELIPSDDEALAELIFRQPDYKDRSVRDAEEIETLKLV